MDLDNFKYNLSNLKKCNQYWDEMNPVSGGRLCNKCAKTIVDFSKMTFTDIAFFMAESNEPVCGFYLPEQIEQTKIPKSKFPIAVGLTTLLATSTISKAEMVSSTTEQNILKIKYNEENQSDNFKNELANKSDTLFIVGKIKYFDSVTNKFEPVPHVSVIIKNPRLGVVSDKNGEFRLRYGIANNPKIYLRVSAVGFLAKEIEIDYNTQNEINVGDIILKKNDIKLT